MTTSEPVDLEARARFVNEELVDLALELVAAVRDHGPDVVHAICARVPHGAHDSLAVVLAAMIDPDRTPKELLGWVDVPLGVASRDRSRQQAERQRLPREHGTERGYHQHAARRDLPACTPCKAAHTATLAAREQERAVA